MEKLLCINKNMQKSQNKIIGKISSGKPMYNSDGWKEHEEHHKDFTQKDHAEAGKMQRERANKVSDSKERIQANRNAYRHEQAAGLKDGYKKDIERYKDKWDKESKGK